ncbi:MAG: GWxTD domain-containing protein [Gemmatimonadaceae bacterium]
MFDRPRRSHRTLARLVAAVTLASALGGCGASRGDGAANGSARPQGPGLSRDQRNISFDPAPLYRQMGMIAQGLPFPVVGRVGFLGSSTPDSTHVVVAVSFPVTAVSFMREADNRFRANYTVAITLDRAGVRERAVEASETIVVGTYRETTRIDESALFQEILDVAPGRYTLTLAIRDAGSQRSVQEQLEIVVPKLAAGALSSPIPVHEVVPRTHRETLPQLLTSPRATVTFGRDSIIPLYLERYGADDATVQLIVRNENGRPLWTATVPIEQRDSMASGTVAVPVGRLGIGVAQLSFVAEGSADTSSAYVFVGFGEDLPVARFEDMVAFLRYFATAARLQRLRDAPEADRPAAWATFLAETDSTPATAEHEDLRAYFERLSRTNARFREEGVPGWMSDRGKVLVVLGEPDQILEPAFTDFQRNRQQLWEYRSLSLQLVFYDQTGTGRWRLTQSSAVRFETELRRRLR